MAPPTRHDGAKVGRVRLPQSTLNCFLPHFPLSPPGFQTAKVDKAQATVAFARINLSPIASSLTAIDRPRIDGR
jgi:hypothetical protein